MHARILSLPSPLRRAFAVLAVATMLALVAPLASAGVENPRDTPAVHAVHMDMDLMRKIVAINKERDGLEQDSDLFMRTKANHVQKTLDELIAEVHANPPLEAIIARHGLSTREYLLAAMAFSDAGIGLAMTESGEADYVRKQHVSAEHMAFIKAHQDEIAQLGGDD